MNRRTDSLIAYPICEDCRRLSMIDGPKWHIDPERWLFYNVQACSIRYLRMKKDSEKLPRYSGIWKMRVQISVIELSPPGDYGGRDRKRIHLIIADPDSNCQFPWCMYDFAGKMGFWENNCLTQTRRLDEKTVILWDRRAYPSVFPKSLF
jgi:hypothetical protein